MPTISQSSQCLPFHTTSNARGFAFGTVTAFIVLAAIWVGDAHAFVKQGVYEATKSSSCAASNDCQVIFGKVPAGKTLQLSHMSCWGQFADTVSLLVLGLDGSPRHSFVAPVVVGSGNGLANFAVSAEVLKLYTAGQRPTLRLVLTGVSATTVLECQIAGKMKK